ncbi:MAG: hypothetical protein H8E66_08350 [Planctomycetes bacterium]|nr:hypothetical protein [Planctomycetota bacterium]
MSTDRTYKWSRAAVIVLMAGSWFAITGSTGFSVLSAQEPEPASPSDPTVPEPPAPPTVAPSLAQLLARYRRTPSRTRLASVPKMFGDSIGHIAGLTVQSIGFSNPATSTIGIPVGSSRAAKVGDHNAAIPVNRAYFNFNHFHNAIDTTFATPAFTVQSTESINRYTFGWERTFAEGLWSVELRMPFNETYLSASPAPGIIAVGGGNVGNLAVVLKRLIHQSEDTAVAVGLVLDTPTGEDTVASIGPSIYTANNNVMGILPYIGMMYSPDDRHFVHAFLQTDIPLGDNTVHTADATGTPSPQIVGDFTQPTLMYLDVSGGYRLYQNSSASHITALSALLEFHYTTTLHKGKALNGNHVSSNGPETFRFGRQVTDSDVVNFTVALDTELANDWNIRVGSVFPMGADDRFFDSEVAVQATYYR